MRCSKPFMTGFIPRGCGGCPACRINRRRLWTHRILLESMLHDENSFLTLTYDEEHFPEKGHLVPDHVKLWLKRMRKRVSPTRLRFYLVGEYGEKSWRPHYHVALFNYPPCRLLSGPSKKGFCNCSACLPVRETWGHGNIFNGTLTSDSAQYIGGYVTKKMTKVNDLRLNGRPPEFARMSLRPGIGAGYMERVAEELLGPYGDELFLGHDGDVPLSLNHGGKSLPLGRYLRHKLRDAVGWEQNEISEEARLTREASLLAMYIHEKDRPENVGKSFKKILVEKSVQNVRNLEGRAKLFNKTGDL